MGAFAFQIRTTSAPTMGAFSLYRSTGDKTKNRRNETITETRFNVG